MADYGGYGYSGGVQRRAGTGGSHYAGSTYTPPQGIVGQAASSATNAACSTCSGVIMLFVATSLLWWNEGIAITTAKSLAEGLDAVVHVEISPIVNENNGRLVHAAGTLTMAELRDDDFGIAVHGIKLERSVEMLQWKERKREEKHKTSDGGTRTDVFYDYTKEWSSELVSSQNFHRGGHENPRSMPPLHSNQWTAPSKLGDFRLSSSLVSNINSHATVDATMLDPTKLRKLGLTDRGGGEFVHGSSSEVGDWRVRFTLTAANAVSVVAQQDGNGFGAYQTKAGDSLEMLSVGTHSAQTMFEQANSANTMRTWALRVFGYFLFFFAFKLLTAPITILASWLPLLGNFISNILDFGLTIAAFLLAIVCTFITCAIAWLFYRPLVAGGLLLVALVPFIISGGRAKKVPEMH